MTVCVDVGSTFTKAAAIDELGRAIARAESPTTSGSDVLVGLDGAVTALGVGPVRDEDLLVCSSAGGGLRLAVVGQERVVSVEAGRRVALSAGARVVGVWAGRLSPGVVRARHAADPGALATADVILLVGGTDGGDHEVLLHNARILGGSRLRAPVVLAGNRDAAAEAESLLRRGGRVVLRADNVIPRIGELAPESARAAIRSVFIEHVIGGKGLSKRRRFGRLVRAATPDAVLSGVEIVASRRAQISSGDVLVVDIGGATTDVYSVLDGTRDAEAPVPRAVGQAPAGRTVEGDLGMRWSAPDLIVAAQAERLVAPSGDRRAPLSKADATPTTSSDPEGLVQAATRRHSDIGFLPETPRDVEDELALARLAATVAVRRHARPGHGDRDLRGVGLVIGSGGVLRHADPRSACRVLTDVLADRAGGWALPVHPAVTVDADYLLAPIGLLALAGYLPRAEALADHLLAPGLEDD
jgi:uncharacterized protein (TIGR01319 family)